MKCPRLNHRLRAERGVRGCGRVRRLFPAITDTMQAWECARTIAGWKPLAPRPPRLRQSRHRESNRGTNRADRARLELLRELAALEVTLRRAREPAIVLDLENFIDALLDGFGATAKNVVKQLRGEE